MAKYRRYHKPILRYPSAPVKGATGPVEGVSVAEALDRLAELDRQRKLVIEPTPEAKPLVIRGVRVQRPKRPKSATPVFSSVAEALEYSGGESRLLPNWVSEVSAIEAGGEAKPQAMHNASRIVGWDEEYDTMRGMNRPQVIQRAEVETAPCFCCGKNVEVGELLPDKYGRLFCGDECKRKANPFAEVAPRQWMRPAVAMA